MYPSNSLACNSNNQPSLNLSSTQQPALPLPF